MSENVQLVKDDNGIAVFGLLKDVEDFLRARGLLASAVDLDLRRLRPFLAAVSDVTRVASIVSEASGRWFKLTRESAKLVKEFGLVPSKIPGQSHLMVTSHGAIKSWLQAETGSLSFLANPTVLSGVGGILAQVAMSQALDEIRRYVVAVNDKLDRIGRKIDEGKVSLLYGSRQAIDRVLTLEERTGSVDATSWSMVSSVPRDVGDVEGYALRQIDALARDLGQRDIRALSAAVERVSCDIQEWLAVLGECRRLQVAFGEIELGRRFSETPSQIDYCVQGVKATLDGQQVEVSRRTGFLYGQLGKAVDVAQSGRVWNRKASQNIVDGVNEIAAALDEFHGHLAIDATGRRWEVRQLAGRDEITSQTLQFTRDHWIGLLAGGVCVTVGGFAISRQSEDGDEILAELEGGFE